MDLKQILIDHQKWLNEKGGCRADLRWANLQYADLREVDLDFACFPLWCGTNKIKVDRKIAAQVALHFCCLDCDDMNYQKARATIIDFARTSHRAQDMGIA